MNDFDARAKEWDSDPAKVTRAHTIADAIRREVPLHPNMRALEYGAGTGLAGFRLLPHLAGLTLADTSEGMLDVARAKIKALGAANVEAVNMDVTRALPQARFDLIFSLMTLHHIPDTAEALRAFYTLLNRPGYLCVADLDQEDGSFHGLEVDVHHGFDRTALAALARQAGFGEVRFSTAYTMTKQAGGQPRTYPIFLMVAEKT